MEAKLQNLENTGMLDQALTDWLLYRNTHLFWNKERLWQKWIRL